MSRHLRLSLTFSNMVHATGDTIFHRSISERRVTKMLERLSYLHDVLDNESNALKEFQQGLGSISDTWPSVFDDTLSEADETLGVAQRWAERAITLPGSSQSSAF